MSDANNSGFGKFVPGFEFLQSLAKGSSQALPQMPALNSWVAPTLDPQELEKRIGELKAVQFWLDQNATALKATIQALEVQKMTLATLKGMNVDMGSMASAFKFQAPAPVPTPEAAKPAKVTQTTAKTARPKAAEGAAGEATPALDPMQLWGALTQQFQQIAAGAMSEVSKQAAAAAHVAPKSGADRAAPTGAATRKSTKKAAGARRH